MQNLLLPAVFINHPRMFFISMQSLFWALHYILLVDFCLIAIVGLFILVVYWAFLLGLLMPPISVISTRCPSVNCNRLHTQSSSFPSSPPSLELFLCAFPPIYGSISLLCSPGGLTSRSLPQIHSKMVSTVVCVGPAHSRAILYAHSRAFNPPAMRSNRGQSAPVLPSIEMWPFWNVAQCHSVPLALVHDALWSHN